MLQLLDLFRTGYTAALDVEADDSARLFSAFKLESLSVCSENKKCRSIVSMPRTDLKVAVLMSIH